MTPPLTGGARVSRRLRRERRTVEVMIRMHCQAHHGTPVEGRFGLSTLCPACAALLDYSDRRVAECRFGDDKPTCARCTVHCFRATEREEVRRVMRYAGPRMTLRHPYLAIRHLLDRRSRPQPTGRRRATS